MVVSWVLGLVQRASVQPRVWAYRVVSTRIFMYLSRPALSGLALVSIFPNFWWQLYTLSVQARALSPRAMRLGLDCVQP